MSGQNLPGNRLQRFIRAINTPVSDIAERLGERTLRMVQAIKDQPLLLIFLGTFLVVAYLNPAKVGLVIWGINKLALFAMAGFHIDTWLFRKIDALDDATDGVARGNRNKRKGWMVCSAIVVGALLP